MDKNIKLWPVILLCAAAYPGFISAYAWSIAQYNDNGAMTGALIALIIMLTMMFLPIQCLRTLVSINKTPPQNAYQLRIAFNLLVATPPFYIFVGTVTGWIGISSLQSPIWIGFVLLLGAWAFFGSEPQEKAQKSSLNFVLIKKIHRISAILLVVGFIGAHLSNHLFALISNEKHEEIRLLLRTFYASDVIEPIMLFLFFLMVSTGIPMANRYMKAKPDTFRVLQIGTGFYLVLFLCAHINATISARFRDTPTDWIFATGEAGLINGYFILIPYYFLSVLLMWLHVSLGIRAALINKRIDKDRANRIYYRLITIGGLFSAATLAAILGVQIG
ncbi:hypothetical protein [Pseudemcibacter aquimaris]|uniref:hypothetical protein n=1 Tax=Pseudemcibacter aquimaris TaxID=2857064 RepID=UPI0020127FC3|nr:hypothetical protein [Pseudemcibacter aquimaris]MCC3860186.1 hypothetical protein [Pseudemcibacter aquimaris]WDU57512.1 hypothetical protein KW060_09925 [Pseudemcibacter aquimaris]